MSVPEKIWLQFIVDSMNRSLYVENGVIKRSSPPVPLPQLAKGWQDITISFGTNDFYWNLARSFSVPMFFVGDGAEICRDAVYAKKGYEEELYIIVMKKNLNTGIYELEYRGRLDFSKNIDEPRKGITVNSIEGGALSYVYANDSVPYALPLDPSNNTGVRQIMFDGVNLFDRYRYSTVNVTVEKPTDFDHHVMAYTLPFPFISNDGDSVGVIQGSQNLENIANSGSWANSMIYPYTNSSANYCFSSINPTTIRITGNLSFRVNRNGTAFFGVHVGFQTSLNAGVNGNGYPILGGSLGNVDAYVDYPSSQDVTVPVDVTIDLAAGERLFLIVVVSSNSTLANNIEWKTADMFIEFNSKVPPSPAYGLPIIDLLKQLVIKMTGGRYTGNSVYFSNKKNIIFTSTNAIQNYAFNVYYGDFETVETGGVYVIKIPGKLKTFPSGNQIVITGATSNNGIYTVKNVSGVIGGITTIEVVEPVTDAILSGNISTVPDLQITFKDFFNDVDCLYNIGMKVVNDVVYIEPKATLYDDNAEIFDIGEITKLKLKYASEMLVNVGEFGYKSQDYRQRNGVYEFNTTTFFKFPPNTINKKYTRVCKSRGDCFGIEFIRNNVFNKPTTDNTGDNQPFMVNTKPAQPDVDATVTFNAALNMLIVPGGISFVVGDQFQISGSTSNNNLLTVIAVGSILVAQLIFVSGGPVVDEVNVLVNIDFVLSNSLVVLREVYDDMAGTLDNTVYNIEEMTPHRMMLAHGNTLRSLMVQMQNEYIEFSKADKNSALTTTLAGVIIAERQPELIGGLNDILFYPWYAEFLTPVPLSFSMIMANIGTGYIKGTFYGYPIYFLPIGKMDAKPAKNAAQSWKLMLAPMNNLSVIKQLSNEGLFTIDTMGNSIFTTDMNSLHFNKYDYQLPAKYQHKEIYDDQFQNRLDYYKDVSDVVYPQKVQKTETYPIQQITKGLSQPNVELYNSKGVLVSTNPMAAGSNPQVIAPYFLWNYDFDPSSLDEGLYFIVISCAGVKLRITELLDVRALHEGTLLFEAQHTTSKYNTYFNSYVSRVRVEAILLPWYPDSSFEGYTDELADYEALDGIPVPKRNLRIKFVPDWMALKINRMLLLNRCFIEGVRYSRTPESKVTKKEVVGSPMNSYIVEIAKATNHNGLSTNEVGTEEDTAIIYVLDAQAFGTAAPGAVINIEVPIEP